MADAVSPKLRRIRDLSLDARLRLIRKIEDRYHRHRDRRYWSHNNSPWYDGEYLHLLEEIDRRHGVSLDDPRVYSIRAFKAEKAAIEVETKSFSADYRAACRRWHAGGEVGNEPGYGIESHRSHARQVDCRARHFPGLFLPDSNPSTTAARVSSRPKLWAYIEDRLRSGRDRLERTPGLVPPLDASEVERVYGIMHRIGIPWAPAPPYDHLGRLGALQVIDELQRIANRLEDEDDRDCGEGPGRAAAITAPNGAGAGDAACDESETPSRISTDRLTLTVKLDETDHSIGNPIAFTIIEAIVRANGHVVETEDLLKLPGCLGKRIDHILNDNGKVPDAIRAVIASTRGGGAGYYLRLPRRK